MPDRPGDNLPRPHTSGRWDHATDPDEYVVINGHGGVLAIVDDYPDAQAIAALPDWIAAHDAEKARADGAEGLLNASIRGMTTLREQMEAEKSRAERAEAVLAAIAEYAHQWAGNPEEGAKGDGEYLARKIIDLFDRLRVYGDAE